MTELKYKTERHEGGWRCQCDTLFNRWQTDSDSRVLVGCLEEVAMELVLVGLEGFGQAF